MKIFKLVFCIIAISYVISVLSMEKNKVQKIDGKVFSKFRTIPTLTTWCLSALALDVFNKIKDSTYDLEQFKHLVAFLDAKNIGSDRLLSLLREEVEGNEWDSCNTDSNKYKVNQIHFSGSRYVWNNPKDNYTHLKSANIEKIGYAELIYALYSSLVFAISEQYFAIKMIQDNKLQILDFKSGKLLSFKTNNSPYSAIALDPQRLRCALANEAGELFMISLDNSDEKLEYTKIEKIGVFPINVLFFTPNSQLYSCDNEGNIFVGHENSMQKLPIRKRISSFVSSADSSLVAFQHADEVQASSILDWNALRITEYKFGKIVAITQNRKILSFDQNCLFLYSLQGELLKKIQLPQTAQLHGNEMPCALRSLPLYVMTTEERRSETVDDYEYSEDFPSNRGSYNLVKKGTRTEERIYTKFFLPKKLSSEEIFTKLQSTNKNLMY